MAGRFKSYFFRGLAVLLPTILTIWIFVWGYRFIQENISRHIADGLEWLLVFIAPEAFVEKLDWKWMGIALSAAGFLVALFIVFMVGALLASVVGRTLWRMVEKFIMNTPFLRQVYPYVKQVTDFFLQKGISYDSYTHFADALYRLCNNGAEEADHRFRYDNRGSIEIYRQRRGYRAGSEAGDGCFTGA